MLIGFDDESENGELSVANKIAPKAFSLGWRLFSWAPIMVTAVRSVALAQNITDDVRIPMQYLRSWLLALLYHITQTGIDPRNLGLPAVIDCLKSTNFATVLQYYVEVRDEKQKDEKAKKVQST